MCWNGEAKESYAQQGIFLGIFCLLWHLKGPCVLVLDTIALTMQPLPSHPLQQTTIPQMSP